MKKRTHTHTYFEISSSRVHDFTLVVEAFFGPWTKIGPLTFFFSFPFFSSSSQNTLSLCVCVCVCVFYYRVTKRSTHPAAGEKASRVYYSLCLFHRARSSCSLYAAISYVFFFIAKTRQKNKSQATEEKESRRGGEVLEEFFFWVGVGGGEEQNRKKEKKQKKKKNRKKTFINFAPVTGTLGRKRKKECKERESEESKSEWCVKFRFSSARC